MPNRNASNGFQPHRYLNGTSWNGQFNTYFIPSTDTSAYAIGDPVKSAAGGDANGVPAVQKAAGTDAVRGVVVGCLVQMPASPNLQGTALDLAVQTIPATKLKGYYVMVVDDPMVQFEIQDDGLNILTAAACGKNASFTVANPAGLQQNSGSQLNTASVATTNTLNLKIMGLVQRDDNAFGANARWVVKFNLHELSGGTAGV